MVNYVCVKFYQIASNVRSKVKISRGSMPPDSPSLPHALHMNTYLPSDNPYNPILPPPPLGKKLKGTPIWLGLPSPLLHTASNQKFAGGGLRTRLSKPQDSSHEFILNRSVWASLRFEWWVVQFLTLRNWWLNWRWLSWVLYNGGVTCKK